MDIKETVKEKFDCCKDWLAEKYSALPNRLRYGIIAGICAIFVLVAAAWWMFLAGSAQGHGSNVALNIKPGMTTAEIAEELQAKGVIHSAAGLRLMARLGGYDKGFREGLYYFRGNMRPGAVLAGLEAGPEDSVVRVTIPEGYTVDDIARLMEAKGLVMKEDFCKAAEKFAPYDYMKEALEQKDIKYAAEGFLFPDTYDFDRTYSAEDIMQIMADNFDRKLTADMRAQAESRGLSVFKLITMASLVEKEAKFAEDRPIIADVFYKRLEAGMPLQSDATIQYALDEHKEEFSLEDTKLDSPYNTYQHQGLTPGPIGNPGLASIEAALNPAHTDYMYFVADGEGHNHYSVTYDEHQQAIKDIYGE